MANEYASYNAESINHRDTRFGSAAQQCRHTGRQHVTPHALNGSAGSLPPLWKRAGPLKTICLSSGCRGKGEFSSWLLQPPQQALLHLPVSSLTAAPSHPALGASVRPAGALPQGERDNRAQPPRTGRRLISQICPDKGKKRYPSCVGPLERSRFHCYRFSSPSEPLTVQHRDTAETGSHRRRAGRRPEASPRSAPADAAPCFRAPRSTVYAHLEWRRGDGSWLQGRGWLKSALSVSLGPWRGRPPACAYHRAARRAGTAPGSEGSLRSSVLCVLQGFCPALAPVSGTVGGCEGQKNMENKPVSCDSPS